MAAYHNEIDPYAAQWLRELIKSGHIAPGDVDERSIVDVRPSDLAGYTQCHFFAGIGVWSHALRRAGWPDDAPIWTGSCPCQPFSAAGKGAGFDDERHLWPHFHYLIEQCQPAVVAGEQVASKDGLAWLDLVQADMEATGYAFGAVDTCAAGFGAPHIRQRLYWIGERGVGQANACGSGLERQDARAVGHQRASAERGGWVDGLVELDSSRARAQSGSYSQTCEKEAGGARADDSATLSLRAGAAGRLADNAPGGRGEERANSGGRPVGDRAEGRSARLGHDRRNSRPGPTNGLWADADWLHCRDGKWRPVEPSTFPLAHGAPARVGRLRGYGNAINAEAATVFIEAYLGR